MLPGKQDAIWQSFVSCDKEYEFTCLATKMMYTRIKQHVRGGGTADEAIDIVHEFFEKNINIVQDDLKLILG